jgi:hypothetical protein
MFLELFYVLGTSHSFLFNVSNIIDLLYRCPGNGLNIYIYLVTSDGVGLVSRTRELRAVCHNIFVN